MHDLRERARDEDRGYTLIELLVVMLVIGILATIAIPTFLNQQGKAYDASAKELAHSAQVAAETYATDNSGSYANLTPTALSHYDASIQIATTIASAYVVGVSGADSHGYTITVAPASGTERFSIARTNGAVSRTCTPATGLHGGCANGTW